jgi:3-hydroxyanthranilate 3,4-dioxygenase
MDFLSTYHLKRWVEEHRHLFAPPQKTNRVLAAHADFIVMILHGPNSRLDFHVDPGDEFFYQIHGDLALHIKPAGERRQVIPVREGEIFVCPAGVAHSPRRSADTWGLVIERRRRPEETEGLVLYCEQCDTQVYSRTLSQGDMAGEVARTYESLNADPRIRTCMHCGYVFPLAPKAERLGFLDAGQR